MPRRKAFIASEPDIEEVILDHKEALRRAVLNNEADADLFEDRYGESAKEKQHG